VWLLPQHLSSFPNKTSIMQRLDNVTCQRYLSRDKFDQGEFRRHSIRRRHPFEVSTELGEVSPRDKRG